MGRYGYHLGKCKGGHRQTLSRLHTNMLIIANKYALKLNVGTHAAGG